MEASSTLLSLISSSPSYQNHCYSSSTSKRQPPQFISFSPLPFSKCRRFPNSQNPSLFSACPPGTSLHQTNSSSSASVLSAPVGQFLQNSADSLPPPSSSQRDILPKIDKSGRFCSPRAARELALLIIYAACLEGSDPVRLFEKRLNSRREPGYKFDKESLMEYNHMSFGGPPITVDTNEEADELSRSDEQESEIEAEVLSAPPKLVYSKLILRFTRKLLVAVVEKWDSNVLVIDKVVPDNWKKAPASRILELSILHLAMSEIAILHTRHQIVINEAVDLAKRFCDGAAPRVINGCLRTFVKDLGGTSADQSLKS